MMRLGRVLLVAGLLAGFGLPAFAQYHRVSPHEVVSSLISNDRVMFIYGRPYTKAPRTGEVRKIWGGLVPYGKIWRMGADEATLMTTEVPIVMGGVTIPAGAYSVWMLPNEDGTAKLIINKQVGQWGVDERGWHKVYDEANDVVRADMKKSDLPESVDQFTISVERDPAVEGGGLIKLKWEKTQYSVPFTVAK
ncbi:MAG: DUF2911 domain-containing protein [Phycisphaerae bacterium]